MYRLNLSFAFNINVYTKLLGIYLFSLVIFYPYGIIIADNSFRISDILTILLITSGVLLILKSKRVYKNITKVWFIIPFFFLEVILHLVGIMQYPDISPMSSVRVIFLYLPLLLVFLMYEENEMNKLNITFEKSLKISLIATFIYSVIQLGVVYGYLPLSFLLQQYLEAIAVDDHFNVLDGNRVSGFFNNGIGLSIFGIACFSYFLPKLLHSYRKSYMLYVLFSALLIIFSSTRVALIIMVILFVINLLFAPSPFIYKLKILVNSALLLFISFVIVNFTIGLETIFYRFNRLGEGLENDYSYSFRVNHLWPGVIDSVKDLPFGTLVQPFNIVGLIDSGYLSYYAQGKWLFIFAMALFLIGTVTYALFTYNRSRNKTVNMFVFNIVVYMIIEAITHNPMRNPLLLFFLFIGLANLIFVTKSKKTESEQTKRAA